MKTIVLDLNEDEYHDFIDLLDNCIDSEFPSINNIISEIIMRKIECD